MKFYKLRILTPSEIFYEGEVVSTTAPGEIGYLGIWAHHAPLLTRCVPGKLYFRSEDGAESRFAIGSGFLEVLKNQVTLLTDSIRAA